MTLPRRFSFKMSFNCTSRDDSLAIWKIINEEDAVLIPKNQGENFSSGFLHSEFFGAGWATVPPLHWLLLCLRVIVIQPGFVHGHQSRPTRNHFDCAKKIPKVAQTTGTVDVFDPHSGISGHTSRRASACLNLIFHKYIKFYKLHSMLYTMESVHLYFNLIYWSNATS